MVWTDYLLALPITLLAFFALGILLIDFMLPQERKWANAATAFIGVCFSAAAIWNPIRPGILTYLDYQRIPGAYIRSPSGWIATVRRPCFLLASAAPTDAGAP